HRRPAPYGDGIRCGACRRPHRAPDARGGSDVARSALAVEPARRRDRRGLLRAALGSSEPALEDAPARAAALRLPAADVRAQRDQQLLRPPQLRTARRGSLTHARAVAAEAPAPPHVPVLLGGGGDCAVVRAGTARASAL